MAIIRITNELLYNEEIFDILIDSFDSIEEIKEEHDGPYNVSVLRVQHEEIPKEDKIICPDIYQFKGVRPFIINFNV